MPVMEDEGQNPYARKAAEAIVSSDPDASFSFAMLAVAWEVRQARKVLEPMGELMRRVLEEDEAIVFVPGDQFGEGT